MSKFLERSGGTMAVWTLALLAVTAAARGEEPKCECPLQAALHGTGFPMLCDLPIVGRLFRVTTSECPAECRADHLEHFDIQLSLGDELLTPRVIVVKRFDGQQCAAECSDAKCCTEQCSQCESLKAEQTVKHAAGHSADGKPSWEYIVELASEKAALAATLEAKEASSEVQSEIFESIVELVAENAALEAKLEFQSERDELAKQVQELAAENAKLKAQVELTSLRSEMLQKTMQVAVENEHLKHRVAELERQSGVEPAAARTARRSQASKKAR